MNWLRRLLRPLATLLSFIAGLMFVGAAHDWLPGWSTLAIVVLILFIIGFVIFIHELGHALAYRWQNGVVNEFAVLFLAWRRPREGERGSLGWARRAGADIGGYVIGHFGTDIPTRRKAVVVAAAGPLANLLLAGFMLFCAAMLFEVTVVSAHDPARAIMAPHAATLSAGIEPSELPANNDVEAALALADWLRIMATTQAILVLVGFSSLVTGMINLIPFAGSDGAAILRQLLGGRDAT